ncbi:peroxisome biogenesis factor 2 [Folsomia candida]|uniref:RING-type E3 ubiquitin transferase (cysteine targeting) n=1 Tax=Folsomia candida TaxID=158441 RepID=A0A226DY67_FOLCA|nr:peroxisome biogenesis factor 2 [Folsomia candida]OXA49978.1 Peroxisome biogenesis factor 2 [Folsomia candida]
MSIYVSRVVQLDALILDTEFYSLIKNQVFNILNKFQLGGIAQKYGPEIQLLAKFVIWRLSTYRKDASIGQTLLGIKYFSDKSILKYLFVFESVIPYLYERCVPLLRSQPFYPKIEKPLRYAEDAIKICEILNFLMFLMQNKYPSLVNRILKVKMTPAFDRVNPVVGYSYQLREMLWHQFADFLIIVLPIVNIHRVKRYLRQWGFNSTTSSTPVSRNGGTLSHSVLKCCLCNEDAVIPQHFDSCVFCYYCLKANKMADPEFRCTSCIHASKP